MDLAFERPDGIGWMSRNHLAHLQQALAPLCGTGIGVGDRLGKRVVEVEGVDHLRSGSFEAFKRRDKIAVKVAPWPR